LNWILQLVVCPGHLRIVCAVDRVDLLWVKVGRDRLYRDRVSRDRVRRDRVRRDRVRRDRVRRDRVRRDRVRRDRVRRDWEVAETGKIFVEVFPQLNRNRPIFHHLHRRRLHRENVLALKEAGLADQSI
jgi:hypothetical protein